MANRALAIASGQKQERGHTASRLLSWTTSGSAD
jgi:hypothetical protein